MKCAICGADIDKDDFWGQTPEGPAHVRCVLDRTPPGEAEEGVGYAESIELLRRELLTGPRLEG